jgi:hypothetical protein
VADERALVGASDVEPALERRADVAQRRLAGPDVGRRGLDEHVGRPRRSARRKRKALLSAPRLGGPSFPGASSAWPEGSAPGLRVATRRIKPSKLAAQGFGRRETPALEPNTSRFNALQTKLFAGVGIRDCPPRLTTAPDNQGSSSLFPLC